MRLTKIYTKTGDKGDTRLATGEKLSKASARIEAYGMVDELNSFIALLSDSLAEHKSFGLLVEQLTQIQNELFDVGGELATPPAHLNVDRQQVVGKAEIERLERELDVYNENLPPLKNFVLPGGHRANSLAHVARTICRRAERQVVRLRNEDQARDEVLIYLNRLSDWFFVVSRHISVTLNVPEVLWAQRKPQK